MSPDQAPAPKGRGWLRVLIAFVVAFDVAAFFQWADGAFQSEFGGHPAEAENYLAGVRARDSLRHAPDREAGGSGSSAASRPREKWSFPAVLGGWMSVFGTSRIAVLLFMTTLAAGTTALIFGAVRRELGDWAAAVASLLWLCAPAVRESYETILPEQSGAFILTGAALLWARMMDEGDPLRAAACKWIGSAALLGSGLVLASAFAVAMEIAPGDPRAAWAFLRECVSVPGIAVAAFAIVGMGMRLHSEVRMNAARVALAALVAGVLFARWMKGGTGDVRVLAVATPALAMLAVRGAVALAGNVGLRAALVAELPRRRALWLFLLLLLSLPPDLLSPRAKDWRGFGPVASALIEESHGPSRVLVVSDALGEGMFLSELAMQDRARRITAERGSETLVEPRNADAVDPAQRFLDDEHLVAHLISGHFQYIVLDSAPAMEVRAGYRDQIRRVVEDNAHSFWPIFFSPFVRDGETMGHPLQIFRVMQPNGPELR